MSRLLCLLLCLGLTASVVPVEVLAQDTKQPKKEDIIAAKLTPAGKAVQDLHMAFRLARYGREHKAPEALVMAARVIGTTPMQKGNEKLAKDLKPYDPVKDAEDLLAEALKMPGANAEIKNLAANTRKIIDERPRGAEGGPRVYEGFVGPGETATYQVRFVIGELATISVRTFTATDLDLYVVCNRSGWTTNDRSPSPDCYVAFTVGTISTAGFTIRVVNCDTQMTGRYILFTN